MKHILKPFVTLITLGVLSLAVVGCNRQETPAQTRADVSEAQRDGANDVADERREARNDMNKSGENAAEGRREVALAQAKAAHEVAIERCEAMTGEPRTTCKKQADATRDRAEAQAKLDESASSQY